MTFEETGKCDPFLKEKTINKNQLWGDPDFGIGRERFSTTGFNYSQWYKGKYAHNEKTNTRAIKTIINNRYLEVKNITLKFYLRKNKNVCPHKANVQKSGAASLIMCSKWK